MKKENIEFIDYYSSLLAIYLPCACGNVCCFIASQFALESAFGTSDLFKQFNNISGMKVPSHRPTVGFHIEHYKYSAFNYYSSVLHSVLDYIYWLSYNRIGIRELKNLDLFVLSLRNCGYCPEKDYISKIQSIYQQFKSSQND